MDMDISQEELDATADRLTDCLQSCPLELSAELLATSVGQSPAAFRAAAQVDTSQVDTSQDADNLDLLVEIATFSTQDDIDDFIANGNGASIAEVSVDPSIAADQAAAQTEAQTPIVGAHEVNIIKIV